MIHVRTEKDYDNKGRFLKSARFICNHTNDVVAFGAYDKYGTFQLVSNGGETMTNHTCMATAWNSLNKHMREKRGY